MTCGHSRYAAFCSEECMLDAHDRVHIYPEEWADECSICMERVEAMRDDQLDHLKGAA